MTMKVHVVSTLPAASVENRKTCFLGGSLAVVDFCNTIDRFSNLRMMKTATEKHVPKYEKKIRYGRVFVSAPSGGGSRCM